MGIAILLLLFLLLPVLRGPDTVPDSHLTPGIFGVVASDQMCNPHARYSSKLRYMSDDLKRTVFNRYAIPYSQHSHYEVDHLVSLEINAGPRDPNNPQSPNSVSNLWPEPYEGYNGTVWGAHTKDKLENRLKREVCAGTISLSEAQHDIATDWIGTYKRLFHTDHALPGRE